MAGGRVGLRTDATAFYPKASRRPAPAREPGAHFEPFLGSGARFFDLVDRGLRGMSRVTRLYERNADVRAAGLLTWRVPPGAPMLR